MANHDSRSWLVTMGVAYSGQAFSPDARSHTSETPCEAKLTQQHAEVHTSLRLKH